MWPKDEQTLIFEKLKVRRKFHHSFDFYLPMPVQFAANWYFPAPGASTKALNSRFNMKILASLRKKGKWLSQRSQCGAALFRVQETHGAGHGD